MTRFSRMRGVPLLCMPFASMPGDASRGARIAFHCSVNLLIMSGLHLRRVTMCMLPVSDGVTIALKK